LHPSRRSAPTACALSSGWQNPRPPAMTSAVRSRVIFRQPKPSVSSRSRSVWIAAVEGLSDKTPRTSIPTREIPKLSPNLFRLSPRVHRSSTGFPQEHAQARDAVSVVQLSK
jgi:hypothetical protein